MILACLLVARFSRERIEDSRFERGAAMVEYALLVTLVAIVLIGAIRFFGQDLSEEFGHIDCKLDDPDAAC